MPQQPRYLSTDPNAGDAPAGDGRYLSTDPSAGEPTASAESQSDAGGGVGAFVGGVWKSVNPFAAASALVQAATSPIETVKNIGAAQGQLYTKAKDAFGRGDYLTGSRHAVNYILPLIGPALDEAADKMQAGQVAEGAGEAVGLGLGIAGPSMIGKTRVPVTPRFRNPNPAERAAVAYGERAGIPVDAATATGNPVVRGAQWLSDRTIGGSRVSAGARQAQGEAFARTGEQLSERVRPGGAVTPEQAGQGIRDAITSKIQGYHGEATKAYDALRSLELDPKHQQTVTIMREGPMQSNGARLMVPEQVTMAMPVDLKAAKAALKPVYDRMTRQMPVTQQQASKGLKALDNIVHGPDFAPLSQVDADLGAIKTIARSEMPELRDVGQGLAANAVSELSKRVDATARTAGPDAVQALAAGRTATRAKYGAADVLDRLRAEPVQVFNQSTWQKDAGIQQLRDVAKLAPGELPKLGRAYLDDLFGQATAAGGFDKGATLWSKWQQLGPQTKTMLYKDPALVRDLDNFFLLAKKAAENPNPSGSALVGFLVPQGFYLVTDPVTGTLIQISGAGVSKLLHSPRGARLLSQGLSVQIGSKTRAAATAAEILKAAGADAVPMPMTPALAGQEQQ